MLPEVFQRAGFLGWFSVSPEHQFDFGAANQLFPEGKKNFQDFRGKIIHVLITGNMDDQSNYALEKRKTTQENSQNTKGAS